MRSRSIRRNSRLIIALLFISSGIAWFLVRRTPPTVQAFKPTGYLRATDGDKTHTQMTEEAIRELIEGEGIIPGITKISKSMQKAIDDIKWGNANSDLDLAGKYLLDEQHFTGERIMGSQARLFNQFIKIRTSLRDNKVKPARKAVGESLHAIQDFYTHSNWVEKGNFSINPSVGDFSATASLLAAAALPNEVTCVDCEIENCLDCVNNIITPRLTTAYFQSIPLKDLKPFGKCSHGGTHFDLSQDDPATGGMNKDTLDCEVSPHNYLHLTAAMIAKQHTKEYFRYLKKNLSLRQFKALLGVGNTLAFAIDTSGSMSEEIAGVKFGASLIVDLRVDTVIEPAKYVLVEINDPYSMIDADTDDANVFKSALNGLGASGGGDCPELAFMGILDALSRFDESGGDLLVFTDATAKDGGLAGAVIASAQEKNVKITFMLSGSCSPVDPEFYRISRETGGQNFLIDENEAFEATKLADFAVRPDSVDIAHVNGILSATPATYTVPVDSTLTSVTFSVSGTDNVTITRPNGSIVNPTDSGVTPANMTGSKVLSIANPTAGTWSVSVAGDGEFTMRVMGESPLRFSSFNVVEARGFAGHEGYKPITGQPIAGQPSKVSGELSAGTYNSANLELRTPGGAVVQSLTMSEIPNLEGASSRLYLGDATLPSVPVLAYATGTDLNGQPFQRVVPEVLKPQTVKVSAPAVELIYPGHEQTFTVQVTNYGALGTFELNATDDNDFLNYVSPSAFTLNTGQSIEVTVNVKPPASVSSSIIDKVTLSVDSTGSVETKNSALTELHVVPELQVGPSSVLGGDPSIGTISLFNGPAPEAGTVVTLTSSDPNIATVPATVTIPFGRGDEAFVVLTAAVTQLTPITITASYGSVNLTTVLQVAPASDSLVAVEVNPSTVVGSKRSRATIALNGSAPVGGAQVTLSSNAAAASVPATVTVPEGSSGVTFDITTTAVTSPTTATITATYNGISRTASLTVIPVAIDSMSIEPDDVAGGSSTSAVITLNAPAPAGGALVTLESGNPSIVTVPATVTVPAGLIFATFSGSVATIAPTVTTSVAIRASYQGVTQSGYVRVTPGPVPSKLYLEPSKLAGGQTSTGLVELNGIAPAGGVLVTLGTTDTTVVTLPADVTVPAGSTSATFEITTSAVTSMVSVSIVATANGVGRTELMTIVPTSLESVSLVPSSIGAGNTAAGQITLSNPAPSGGVLVSLSSTNPAVAPVPPTVAVAGGATTATFSVNTAAVELGTTLTILASYGEDTKTATLRVFGMNDVFGTIVPNGPPVTITTTTSGQNARLVFEGTAGQRVSLKMSGITISAANVNLLKVDGTNLTNNMFVSPSPAFLDTTTLPATGTYTIVIDPSGTAVGSMTLQLYDVPADVSGSIAMDGAPVIVTTTAPGQNARLTFDATAGQRITVQISNVSMSTSSGAQFFLLNPSQTVISGPYQLASGGEFIDATALAATGTYTLLVNPVSDGTGSATLKLTSVADDINASITPGGAPVTVTTTSIGQNANVTFTGVTGQRVSLKVTGVAMTGGNGYVDIAIKKPDNSTLASDTFVSTSGTYIDTKVLPVNGTFNVFVNPQSTNTGSVTLTLYDVPADVTGTIVAGGAPVTVTTTVPGQNGQLSFNGTANQRVTLNIGGVSMAGGNGYLDVSIKKPDGSQLASSTFINSGGGFINTQTLPVTGAYIILVNPQSQNTGSATLTLNDVSADVVDTITPGGPPVTVTTTSVGQNAQVTFEGTIDQRVSLKITGVSLTGGNGYVDVRLKKPDGTTLGSETFINSSGGFLDRKTLPVTGTYTILVDPQGTNIGSVTLTLYDVPANITGPIIPGGSSVTVTTTTPGQNVELPFAGITNQRVFLRASSVTLTGGSPNYATLWIRKPDGTSVYSTTIDSSGGYIDTQTLPVDGAYSVVVDPWNSATGSATLTLYNVPADITTTITPGDPAITVTTTSPGQNGRLLFAGTAGQRVFVRVTTVSLTGGSPNWANVGIRKPDGSNLSSTTVDSGGGIIDTQTLPVTGTYTLLIDPQNFTSGSVTARLYDVPADVSGTIVPGGGAMNLATTGVGQNVNLTFSGTLNQRVSLAITNIVVTNSGTMVAYIRKPDGSTLALTSIGGTSGYIDVKVLPATGTYSVFIDPNSFNTASFTLTLYDVPADVSTSTTINASAISVANAVPGQNVLVTFPGTAGQQVTVRLTNNLIGSVSIRLLRPDGTQQASTSHVSSSFNMSTQTLATTGTYTVVVDPSSSGVASISVRVTSP